MAKAKKAKGSGKAKSAAAKKRPAEARFPGAKDLAALLGVKLGPRLPPAQIQRLRKALPGYVSILDDAAHQLEEDADLLNLPDVSPEALLSAQRDLKSLTAREAAAETVYRALYEQRLQLDDRAIGMIQKLARRVVQISEDDPDLLVRWKFLRDFISEFRPGRPAKAPPPPATGGGTATG